MATLHIALAEGFRDDSVAIYIDGRKAYEKSHLTTNLSSSVADMTEIEVEHQVVELRIDVGSRDISSAASANPAEKPYLSASIGEDGSLILDASGTPFRYM